MKPINIKKNIKKFSTAIITVGGISSALAFSPSAYVTSSRLSEGHWVKISTDTAGVCEIPYDKLRQWGYSDPTAVNVYGHGPLSLFDDALDTPRPDDITPTFSINDTVRERIFFYSPGVVEVKMTSAGTNGITIDRSPFAKRASFLLSDRPVFESDTIPRPISAPGDVSQPIDAHYSVDLVEYEFQNPADGGAVFLGPDITHNNEVFFTFDFKKMGSGSTKWSTAYMNVAFAGIDAGGQTRATLDLRDNIKTSEAKITTTAIPLVYDETIAYRHGSIQMSWTRPLDGQRTFGITPYLKTTPRFLAFDNAWTAYPRLSRMDDADACLDMFFPGVFSSNSFSLDAPSSVRVLNITNPEAIFEHSLISEATSSRLLGRFDRSYTSSQDNSDPVCRLIAFNPDVAQLQVEYEGEVPNSNLHGLATPEMLIITTPEMKPAADELAAIHAATDGLECLVATDDLIFNEFSYSTPDAMAYRRFAKMLYDRDPGRLRYVLLYGPGHWDNRGILADRSGSLLTYQVKNQLHAGNTTRNYNADAFFGMLGDKNHNSGIQATSATVAVGRIPAPTPAAGRVVNSKIKKALSSPRPARLFSEALVISDDGDRNVHFTQAEQLIEILQEKHPPMTVVRAHNLIYPWEGSEAKMARELVTNTIIDGVGLMTYTGHGHPNGLTGEQLWSRSAVQSFEADYPPFVFLSTCDALAFDRDQEGIGATMLLKENGGASAVIGACRTVYSPQNQELMTKLTDAYAKADPTTTIGDVWLKGRQATINALSASVATMFNTMCYNLCGDPSLPIGAPDYSVSIDRVNETDPGDSLTLTAHRPVTIAGHIVNPDGTRAKTFNGRATVKVFDNPVKVLTMPRKSITDPVDSTFLDHYLLASKTADVSDGEFSLDLYLPYPTAEKGELASKIVVVADGEDSSRASGVLKGVSILTSADLDGEPATGLPVIRQLTINEYSNGEHPVITSGKNHSLLAHGTTDHTGLNSSTAIGMSQSLVLDPESDSPVVLHPASTRFIYDGDSWTLNLPLPALSPGKHDARLTIVDNAGNRASETLGFTVIDQSPYSLSPENDKTTLTAFNSVTFNLVVPNNEDVPSPADSKLIVRDNQGQTVLKVASPVFPYTLTLSDSNLETGRYSIYLTGKNGGTPFSTPRQSLMVIRTDTTQ